MPTTGIIFTLVSARLIGTTAPEPGEVTNTSSAGPITLGGGVSRTKVSGRSTDRSRSYERRPVSTSSAGPNETDLSRVPTPSVGLSHTGAMCLYIFGRASSATAGLLEPRRVTLNARGLIL